MSTPLLLDTCALIWSLSGTEMTDESINAVESAGRNAQLYMSPISVLEIGTLISHERVVFSIEQWLHAIQFQPSLTFTNILPEILLSAVLLPGTPPDDFTDRIILATAREYGYCIVTRDQKILDYARQGYVTYMAC